MDHVLSISGLTVSSASSIWLLWHEIKQRMKDSQRQERIARLKDRIDAHDSDLQNTIDNVTQVNAQLGHAAYSIDQETAKTRQYLKTVQSELKTVDDLHAAALEMMPSAAHLGGFVLLLVGFLLQLAAEVVKVQP